MNESNGKTTKTWMELRILFINYFFSEANKISVTFFCGLYLGIMCILKYSGHPFFWKGSLQKKKVNGTLIRNKILIENDCI